MNGQAKALAWTHGAAKKTLSNLNPACHICGLPGVEAVPPMRYCAPCDFYFAWPLPDVDPVEQFTSAYSGGERVAEMGDFHNRMKRRQTLITDERIGLWSPAYARTLDRLAERFAGGAKVFEIGPGVGAFMHALRRRGHTVRGLDVGQPVVEALRSEGFDMHLGPVETVPVGQWGDTDVVCSFFALHHIMRPVDFFEAIRERWPYATVIIGGYKAITPETAESRNFPPRTWGWWSPSALEHALFIAGYRATVERLPKVGPEVSPPGGLMAPISRLLWTHPALRHGAAVMADTLLRASAKMGIRKQTEGGLWAVATPRT